MSRASLQYYNNTDLIIGAILRGTPRGTAKAAQELADYCTYNSPVDTGAMSWSWYARGAGVDDYFTALNTALRLKPEADPVQPVEPPNKKAAIVSHAVLHPFFVEFGTINMPPRPVLQNAIAAAKDGLVYRVKKEIEVELAGVRS